MKMLKVALLAGALCALPAHAQSLSDNVVGAEHMAGDALQRGDYQTALANLEDASHDAGRLINLANAYAGLGRYADAARVYQAAIRSQSYDVLTADGTVASTRAVAHKGLVRLNQQLASR